LAFALDGSTLTTGGCDGDLLLWDLTGRRSGPSRLRPPTDADLARLWVELGSGASTAMGAVWALSSAPNVAVPFLRKRLQDHGPPPGHVADLIADLETGAFAVRERAESELRGYGPLVELPIQQALQAEPSLDARRRLERLLKDVTGPGERARPARAVQVLEYSATDAARELLQELAAGRAGEFTAREAKAALNRLGR
jgi:hypothetical protein